MSNQVKTAIIPVAGLGTRVLPASKAIPKEMMPVADKPAIQYVIEEAVAAGIEEIVLVTRAGKESIENHFDANFELEHQLEKKGKTAILDSVRDIVPPSVTITSVRQPSAKGLGHAVLCAKNNIANAPFAVLLPDVLLLDHPDFGNDLARMVSNYNDSQASQIMVEAVPEERVEAYGVVDCEGAEINAGETAKIVGMIEKPARDEAPSNLAVVGRYVLPANIMEILAATQPGAGNEIQLTDAIVTLLNQSQVDAYVMSAETHDCGNKFGYVKANIAAGLRHPDFGDALNEHIRSLAK